MSLQLAYQNLSRRVSSYLFVGLAMVLAFCVITLISSIAAGSLDTIRDKAARYFAGHISITLFLNGTAQSSSELLEAAIRSQSTRTIADRSIYYRNDALLFFSGERVQQRKLIGIDLSIEGSEFDGLPFTSGSWQALASAPTPGILISAVAAKILHCQVGDAVTLYLTTDSGQYNSADLIVYGIFNEASLFGYAAYLRIADLNQLIHRPAEAATDIAVYVDKGADVDKAAQRIVDELSKNNRVAPLYRTREERDAGLAAGFTEPTLVVMTQDAQLAQVKQLLDALLYISYFVMGIFLLIIMVGILNTYRVLIHNRKREIGVLRALGMKKAQVKLLFLQEAALLSILASIAGLALTFLLLHLVSALDLSTIPGAALFTENGHLRLNLDLKLCILNFALILSSALMAVWGPATQASRIAPTEAMRSV
jgi:putative ABC transport system permease protein